MFTTLHNSTFTSPSFNSRIGQFIANHTFLWHWLQAHFAAFLAWFEQPHILRIILAWAITFTVVFILISLLGFEPVGILPGTIAAAFQSWAYGGFTPAGGVFATLTSLAMLGWIMPVFVVLAAAVATVVAVIVAVND